MSEDRGQTSQLSSLSYGAATKAFVVVSSLVPYKILIHEDEDEKNQIRSHAYALRPIPYTM